MPPEPTNREISGIGSAMSLAGRPFPTFRCTTATYVLGSTQSKKGLGRIPREAYLRGDKTGRVVVLFLIAVLLGDVPCGTWRCFAIASVFDCVTKVVRDRRVTN